MYKGGGKIKDRTKPWIIILTHGDAGKELVKSAEMILGKLKDVYAFSLLPNMSLNDFTNDVRIVLEEAPKGTLIFVDLFGGTPSNVAVALSKDYDVFIVSGLNIAMLIEADSLRESNVCGKELAIAVTKTGKEACKEITTLFNMSHD